MTVIAASSMVPASFVARPNRFVVRATLGDGSVVAAHLGDPGRLEDLLISGAELRLTPAHGAARRTAYTVSLVRAAGDGEWVSVETTRANRLAEPLLRERAVRGIPAGHSLKREARAGASRFDFLLTREGCPPLWVEVKSVTFVSQGLARFPDAPTERGRRHVGELTERVRCGERAMILFIVQRADAQAVVPYSAIDPEFTSALCAARAAGVVLRAARFRLTASGEAEYLGPLPVRLPRNPG